MTTKNINQRIVCLLLSLCTMFTLLSTAFTIKPEAKSKKDLLLTPNAVYSYSGYMFKCNDDGDKTITILGTSKNMKTFAPPEKIYGYTVTRLGENDGNSYSMIKRVYGKGNFFKEFCKGLYNGLRWLLFPVEKVIALTSFISCPIVLVPLAPISMAVLLSEGAGEKSMNQFLSVVTSPKPIGMLNRNDKPAIYTCKSVDLSKVSKNLTVICDGAFEGLGNKKAIKGCGYFPSLKYIGKNAFAGCKVDQSYFENSMLLQHTPGLTVGENAFANTKFK